MESDDDFSSSTFAFWASYRGAYFFGVLFQMTAIDKDIDCILKVDSLFSNMLMAPVEPQVLGFFCFRFCRRLFGISGSTLAEF